jgi:hypothetical protein
MSNNRILYKFPSRERPYKFFSALDNIISLARHDNYEILATLDINDPSMRGDEIKQRIASYEGRVRAIWGTSEGKIHACNRDLEFVGDFDIICLHSDDMKWLVEGFDLEILMAYEKFSGLLHIPDGYVNERLCTYTILDKAYFNKFNYLYNPEYRSVYCDSEIQDVAKILNAYKYLDKKLLQHQHFIHGFGIKDELLQRTEDPVNYQIDHDTYIRRKLINFGL